MFTNEEIEAIEVNSSIKTFLACRNKFNKTIDAFIEYGASDRKTALIWMVDSFGDVVEEFFTSRLDYMDYDNSRISWRYCSFEENGVSVELVDFIENLKLELSFIAPMKLAA
jgi:hypothetical protein